MKETGQPRADPQKDREITTTKASPAPPSEQRSTLRRSAIRGSIWEILGFGASQIIRFGSSLLLTRLLFPEAFGLANLVTMTVVGLSMVTDMGIEQSVIQNKRGDHPRFLNTAWTMHVLRGLVTGGLVFIFAWPACMLYGTPEYTGFFMMAGVQLVINGFHSTAAFTLRRRIQLGWVKAMELGGQLISLPVIVAWAMIDRSPWALIGGSTVGIVAILVVGHLLPVGYHNRIAWNREDARSIVKFGRWIFASSAVDFVARRIDGLLLSHFLSVAVLGVYTIAISLSEAAGAINNRLTSGVLFPLLSTVTKEHEEPHQLRHIYYRARLRIDLLTMPAIGGLMALGPWVVQIFDDRYHDAGSMLQILCVRVAMEMMMNPCQTFIFALGESHFSFYRNLLRAIFAVAGVITGWYLEGLQGLLWGAALSELVSFFVLWPPMIRRKLLDLRRELLSVALFFGGYGLGYLGDVILVSWFGSQQ